ncbi:MAG: hypothetical protein ACPHCI_08470 [Solirubrobacterales bacterium]
MPTEQQSRPILYLDHDPDNDRLDAIEFGRVADGQPPDSWRWVGRDFAYLHDLSTGRCVGFTVRRFSVFEPDRELERLELWFNHFHAPVLAVNNASADAVFRSARRFFNGEASSNRRYLNAAVKADNLGDAIAALLRSLQTGYLSAHLPLGITRFIHGDQTRAEMHLRTYVELAPCSPDAHRWLAKLYKQIGQHRAARFHRDRAWNLASVDHPMSDLILESLAADQSQEPA